MYSHSHVPKNKTLFYNQLQDTVVRQFDPPHGCYPKTDFRFAPGWNFEFFSFGLWHRILITGVSKETGASVFPYILNKEIEGYSETLRITYEIRRYITHKITS